MPEDTHFLFCWSLRKGGLFAGYFTSTISMVCCAIAFSVFFRESSEDDADYKLVAFSVACYTILYIFMSRSLINGIKDERRDKFVCWIIMSVVTVICLSSGIFFMLNLFYSGKIQENTITTLTVVGAISASTIVSVLLVYCIWGVVQLWSLYGRGNSEGELV